MDMLYQRVYAHFQKIADEKDQAEKKA